MPGSEISRSFLLSLSAHVVIFFVFILLGHATKPMPVLKLTEIDFVEPMEIPEVQEVLQPEPRKTIFKFAKKTPVKRRAAPVAKPRPAVKTSGAQSAAPARRAYIGGAPLIGKRDVMNAGAASEPVISKQSIGQGTAAGAPRWDNGPGARMGGGGKELNLARGTSLSGAERGKVIDAEIAASLKGRRGSLSLHTNDDIQSITKNVGQGKQMEIANHSGGSYASAGGFRDAFAIFGKIRNRKILRLKMPKYPAWAEEQGIEASATIRIGVLPEGIVDESSVFVEATSGYTDLDNLAIEAAKQFIFAPLSTSKQQNIEYGSIRFVFQLKH